MSGSNCSLIFTRHPFHEPRPATLIHQFISFCSRVSWKYNSDKLLYPEADVWNRRSAKNNHHGQFRPSGCSGTAGHVSRMSEPCQRAISMLPGRMLGIRKPVLKNLFVHLAWWDVCDCWLVDVSLIIICAVFASHPLPLIDFISQPDQMVNEVNQGTMDHWFHDN